VHNKGTTEHRILQKSFYVTSKNFQIVDNGESANDIDDKLYAKLTEQKDIRLFIEKFDQTVQTTCRETCKHLNKPNSKVKGRPVPWWTVALKTMRKRTNALRRLYTKGQKITIT
jgi:chromatin segregation and condensation protein Rec8/ScpA/Scc1 (kleisin family)